VAQLTAEQSQLLEKPNFAALATTRADGTAHVTPMWVDYDGDHVVLNTARGRAKEKHILDDPRVTVMVWSAENPYQYVEVSGAARFVDQGADDHIDRMAKKYIGQDVYPWRGPDEVRVIVEVTPEWVGGNV